ncbi:TRAP transporter substrate-binding protein DctP [Cupriavidus sp. IK-TO18]|uniref:TRAP transporter substrate-binding protein DctP n=1 Tax=Cupriavidus sp. IK-TO18 TaxID=2782182 RepID=UPI00189BB19D|nr:TRAP transporter substrate-binding protein DctP [Cupriavidus sp. IK-TO18]MBF6992507.1 TRAP transporter substrate-binding protein DctP [Cupriavidus sp. IK-TO18]
MHSLKSKREQSAQQRAELRGRSHIGSSTMLKLVAACTLMVPVLAQADLAHDWLAAKDVSASHAVRFAGPKTELKYGHPSPPVSLFVPPTQAAIARLEKITNGKLIVHEYGSGSLFDAKGGFKAVRSGVGDWGTCYPTYEGRGMPLSRVWELPYVTPSNPMVAVRIAQELAPKYFAPEFKKQGTVWGMHMAFAPSNLLSKKPIRSVQDLAGLKVAAQGFSPEVAKALGIALVNLPYPELYSALQQGVIDAVFWMDAGFVPYRLAEVAKYYTALELTGGGAWTCYNPESYKHMPRELQEVFYRSLEPFAMAATQVTQVDFAKKAQEAYKKLGVEIIKFSPQEQVKLHTMLKPVVEEWTVKLEKQGLPAKQLLSDIDRLSRKYEKLSPDELMRLSIEQPVAGIQ